MLVYSADAAVQRGPAERFGFITTNSIKQIFARRVVGLGLLVQLLLSVGPASAQVPGVAPS